MPQIIKDVVFDEVGLDADLLLSGTLPQLSRGNAKWFPIFKYLAKANRIVGGNIVTENLSPDIVKRALRVSDTDYHPADKYAKKKKGEVVSKGGSVAGVRKLYGDEHAMTYIPLLPRKIRRDERARGVPS